MEEQETKNFNPLWALALSLLVFNLFPIPFDVLLSFVGSWVYFNPTEVEMGIFGNVILYPVKTSLTVIFSTPLMIYFFVWRMQKRGLDLTNELGLFFFKRSVFFKSILLLALFLVLEEIYMRVLDIVVPVSFLKFILSEPLILGVITTIVIAPILEEFIFRGFLFSQLRITLGNWGAISLSSLAWTSLHFQYELKILFVLFVFGLFLGFLRWKYNSLFLVMALHAVNNLVALIMAYLYLS
jgi:membrane protease YdiL (CAAX protease family)